MAVSFEGLTGRTVTIDELRVSGIGATPDADLLVQGVSRGTRITLSGPSATVDVRESQTLVRAAVQSASAETVALGAVQQGPVQATQTLNAAGPTVISACAVSPDTDGDYAIELRGTLRSTDAAAAGANVQVTVDGAPIGLVLNWPAGALFSNNVNVGSLAALGRIVLPLTEASVVAFRIGVLPGGVGGDDIVLTDGQVLLTKVGS